MPNMWYNLRFLLLQQGAWDMDYGWGGGRFGKRAPSKRYDMYGIGGRFGRDVSRVQQARQADLHQ